MTYKILDWDSELGAQVERDATAEEVADIDSRRAAAAAERRLQYAQDIEAAVMTVYARPVALAREYEMRLTDATAYRDAGYTGEVGRVLAGFATAKAITATQAADIVLAQAAGFHSAELALADLRMRKYEVERAATEDEAMAVHAETMAAIQQIAAAIA